MACKAHLKWVTDHKNEVDLKTKKIESIEFLVIPVPLENNMRRNVLDEEGALLF